MAVGGHALPQLRSNEVGKLAARNNPGFHVEINGIQQHRSKVRFCGLDPQNQCLSV
jgi:hypothetical protein